MSFWDDCYQTPFFLATFGINGRFPSEKRKKPRRCAVALPPPRADGAQQAPTFEDKGFPAKPAGRHLGLKRAACLQGPFRSCEAQKES